MTETANESVTAVGTSIDVEVRPDPASCVITIAQLSALADACARTEALLVTHAQTGEECLGGLSGIVYRHSSTRLTTASERIGRRSRRLADELAVYAGSMAEVDRLMDGAVAVAAPHLTVGGGRIWSPAQPSRPNETRLTEAWAAWHEAKARWRDARDLERETSQAWLGVLGRGVVVDDDEPPVLDQSLDGADR